MNRVLILLWREKWNILRVIVDLYVGEEVGYGVWKGGGSIRDVVFD